MGRRRRGRGAGRPGEEGPPHAGGAFDPLLLLQTLAARRVAYVVIGGVAAGLHGSPALTADLDICYERSRPNLESLAAALQEPHATLRGAEPGLPFQLDARTLELGDHFALSTDAGGLDCLGTPRGTAGYSDLAKLASDFAVHGIRIKAASLDDLIRMKKAAGRPIDRIDLEILGALRDMTDGES